jgi:hypothetical protein
VTVEMDTGCSRCMSGVPGRLVRRTPDIDVSNMVMMGLCDSKCGVDAGGMSYDGKTGYCVSSMPSHLVLLCAHEYAHMVLHDDGGYGYKLAAAEQADVSVFMSRYAPSNVLEVRARTYDVVHGRGADEVGTNAAGDNDETHAATAYLSAKVNGINTEEGVFVFLFLA